MTVVSTLAAGCAVGERDEVLVGHGIRWVGRPDDAATRSGRSHGRSSGAGAAMPLLEGVGGAIDVIDGAGTALALIGKDDVLGEPEDCANAGLLRHVTAITMTTEISRRPFCCIPNRYLRSIALPMNNGALSTVWPSCSARACPRVGFEPVVANRCALGTGVESGARPPGELCSTS